MKEILLMVLDFNIGLAVVVLSLAAWVGLAAAIVWALTG